MVKMLFVSLFVLMSASAHAASMISTAGSPDLPLNEGNWQIGGSAGWYNLGKKSGTLSIAPRAEYFLLDNISVGGGVGLYFGNDVNDSFTLLDTALIPSGTLYFWQGAGMAAYVAQRIPIYFPKYDSVRINGRTALGMDFFINRYVAIAPEIAWSYGSNAGYVDLLASIAAYF